MDEASIDVISNHVYAEGVPYDQFAWLRDHAPAFRQVVADQDMVPEVWLISRYDDVQAVSRAAEQWTVVTGTNLYRDRSSSYVRHLLTTDDPDHLDLRRLTNKGFTPNVVRRYEDHYRQIAADLIDKAVALGTFDAVELLASPLPLMAICELIGAPMSDIGRVFQWTNEITAPAETSAGSAGVQRRSSAMDLFAYADELADDHRDNPRDDIMGRLVDALDAGELSQLEFHSYIYLLFVAGNETTRNNISNGIVALCQHPDQQALLRSDVARYLNGAVDEITRWATPVNYMSRVAATDVEVAGTVIPKGDRIALLYGSANRDPRHFGPSADRFDITRSPNDHLAFGFGTHFCLGVHLAKLETTVMFEELLARTATLELAGPPERLRTSMFNGLKAVPVRVSLPA
jgi:cholest-4-en-3-one 26-monooxygenase